MFRIPVGNVSKGTIVFEKNNKIVPNDIDPIVAVSSDENTQPIIIPSKIKVVVISNNAIDTVVNVDAKAGLIETITPKTITSCMIMINMFVKYVDTMKTMLLVGEMKFLKYALEIFSLITVIEDNSNETNITTIMINVGNRKLI